MQGDWNKSESDLSESGYFPSYRRGNKAKTSWNHWIVGFCCRERPQNSLKCLDPYYHAFFKTAIFTLQWCCYELELLSLILRLKPLLFPQTEPLLISPQVSLPSRSCHHFIMKKLHCQRSLLAKFSKMCYCGVFLSGLQWFCLLFSDVEWPFFVSQSMIWIDFWSCVRCVSHWKTWRFWPTFCFRNPPIRVI